MRGRPKHARGVVHIAVGLDIDREPAVLSVSERGAHGSGRVVADAAATLTADVVIVLIHVPQPARPAADEALPSDE